MNMKVVVVVIVVVVVVIIITQNYHSSSRGGGGTETTETVVRVGFHNVTIPSKSSTKNGTVAECVDYNKRPPMALLITSNGQGGWCQITKHPSLLRSDLILSRYLT